MKHKMFFSDNRPPKAIYPTMDVRQPEAPAQPVSEQPTIPVMQTAVRQPQPQTAQNLAQRIAAEFKQAKTAVLLTLAAGVGVGIYYAWMINPVEWTGGSYKDLVDRDKIAIVQMASDLNAYDPTTGEVMKIARNWADMDAYACALARQEADAAERARLEFLALRLNGEGCR